MDYHRDSLESICHLNLALSCQNPKALKKKGKGKQKGEKFISQALVPGWINSNSNSPLYKTAPNGDPSSAMHEATSSAMPAMSSAMSEPPPAQIPSTPSPPPSLTLPPPAPTTTADKEFWLLFFYHDQPIMESFYHKRPGSDPVGKLIWEIFNNERRRYGRHAAIENAAITDLTVWKFKMKLNPRSAHMKTLLSNLTFIDSEHSYVEPVGMRLTIEELGLESFEYLLIRILGMWHLFLRVGVEVLTLFVVKGADFAEPWKKGNINCCIITS
jgi:hypothetical protein